MVAQAHCTALGELPRFALCRQGFRKVAKVQNLAKKISEDTTTTRSTVSSEQVFRAGLIGRDKEYNLLLDSFRLHVLHHPMLKKWFDRDELPKAICLTGESGTGKTFLTMVSMKQMLLEANRNGLLVSPIVIKGSDVFSEYYGRSTKQIGRLLEKATSTPSVVYIDEFQSFGKKVRGETGTEIEDTRVQDEINRWLDKILSNDARTMVIVATNSYEQTREDIRRRLSRVDLDSGITRDMLLAIVRDKLASEGWRGYRLKKYWRFWRGKLLCADMVRSLRTMS